VIPLAFDRANVADYVQALFLVYFILIFANIVLSFVPQMPYRPWLRAVIDFIHETTDPYLNVFRRIMRPIGGGPLSFDLSPMLALLVLFFAERIIVLAILE
jgi:YggT family protein